MIYQFETMIQVNKEVPKFPVRKTFMEAWQDMYHHVQTLLQSGGLSHQLLETAMWIDFQDKTGTGPVFFLAARDHAIKHYDWSLEKQKAEDAKSVLSSFSKKNRRSKITIKSK